MQFYPAGETITRRLLDLPQERVEWIITGATVDDIIAAGFVHHRVNETCFIHPESGDIYQMARRQYVDEESGQLHYQYDRGITLENELATRALTILAMAVDGDEIIDPFDAQDDIINGVLRHVTPQFVREPHNLLTVAVWASRLAGWGFNVAHSTHGLMKQMVAAGVVEQISLNAISDAVLQAMASPRPAEFFRVLHRCGALVLISKELDTLFEQGNKSSAGQKPHYTDESLPDTMRVLDQAAVESGNISSVMKKFYETLGDKADKVFRSLGLKTLFKDRLNK